MYGEQLDLFSVLKPGDEEQKEEPDRQRSELRKVDARKVEYRRPPFDVDKCMSEIGTLDSECWLGKLIEHKTYMIFLCGQNPSVCQVRCHSNWEYGVEWVVRKAWIDRSVAERLLAKKYYKHGINLMGDGKGQDYAEVYVRRK
jgi:hypothetical protein